MSDDQIMGCNLPTGIPFVYELDQDLKVWSHVTLSDPRYYNQLIFQPVVSMQFLGDEETVKKAIESVANQGKAK